MKLSEINQADIKVISEPSGRATASPAPLKLSDLDPSQVKVVEGSGVIGKALDAIDRYGSAPMRSAYGAVQKGLLERGIPMDVVGGVKAAYDQFGADPSKAPTASELVEQNPIGKVFSNKGVQEAFAGTPAGSAIKMGLLPFVGNERAKEISGKVPKKALEFIVGGETDPLSYVPGAVFEKPLVYAGKKVAQIAPGIANKTAGAAEFFTGVPKESWKNYITRNKEVKDLEKTFGPQVQDAADSMREGWNRAIGDRKSQLGLEIEQAVLNAPRKPNIPAEPILLELNNAKMGLNPNIPEHLSAIREIDDHINVVKALAPEGKLTARDAFDLQKTLQGRGRRAYSVNGALFNPAPQSATAARDAARVTRQFVNKAMPGVAKANEAFTALHDIDDLVRASLITPGKSNAGLMGAVGKTQNQDTVALRELGDWLDKDLLTETRDFATYKHMQGLGADASDKTGKAVYRAMMGGLVGAGGGYASSDDAKIGLIAGGLAGSLGTNPKLWRAAMDAGIGTKAAISGLAGKGGLLEKGAEKVSPMVKSLEKRLQSAGKTAKDFIDDEEGNFSPEDLLNILKPNEENVFDLKKARGLVGEPKKGLLSDKPADVVPHETPWRTVTPTDKEIAQRLGEKVFKRGEQLTVEELDFLSRLKNKIGGGRSENPELYSFKDAIEEAEQKHFGLRRKEFEAEQANKSLPKPTKESPKGLLTSLDVERGPVTERPEAGRQIGEIRMTKDGPKKVVHPTEGEIDAHVAGVNQKWMDEISKRIQGGGTPTKEDGERLFKLSQKFKNPELSDRAQQILDQWEVGIGSAEKAAEAERAKKGLIGVDFGGRGGKPPKAKPSGPAIGEVWSGPSGKKYTVLASETEGGKTYVKVEHVDVSGGPSDGKKITTWEEADDPKIFYGLEKRGESGPKGKRELIDALMSGEKKVPGISIKRGKENPNQGLIDDLWANREKRKPKPVDVPLGGSVELNVSMTNDGGASRPKYRVIESVDDMDGGGYLVENVSTGETHTVSDSEIARVFDENGKLMSNKAKPKGGKGKPKKKKD